MFARISDFAERIDEFGEDWLRAAMRSRVALALLVRAGALCGDAGSAAECAEGVRPADSQLGGELRGTQRIMAAHRAWQEAQQSISSTSGDLPGLRRAAVAAEPPRERRTRPARGSEPRTATPASACGAPAVDRIEQRFRQSLREAKFFHQPEFRN